MEAEGSPMDDLSGTRKQWDSSDDMGMGHGEAQGGTGGASDKARSGGGQVTVICLCMPDEWSSLSHILLLCRGLSQPYQMRNA